MTAIAALADHLPRPSWVETAAGTRLAEALDIAGGRTRLVGGAVRDALLGATAADVDLATQLMPDEVVARMHRAGIKPVPTGIAHGTVTAVADDLVAEVTTLRRDVATDGRHATVAFTAAWQEDAARRDFTINALYADPLGGRIDDYFSGRADLAAGRVRFIGEPHQRIAEDHLRILRFFRFHARFGRGDPDGAGLAACADRANDLMALSRERVRDEVLKLLATANPVPTVAVMLAHGILRPVLPEIHAEAVTVLATVCRREVAAGFVGGSVALRRLAALLPVNAAVLDAVAVRLRLSNGDRRRLALTADRQGGLDELAYRDGLSSAIDRGILRGDDGVNEFAARWTRPTLPISGRHLIARGVVAGPAVSRLLSEIERAWIAAGFPRDIEPILTRILN